MSDGPLVSVRGGRKRFGHTEALRALDLQVMAGEVHGFLGPNGAGKSTTIRALLGLVRLDGGDARVFGLDPWRDVVEVHKRLGYVPGDVSLWPNLTGGEAIDLMIRLRGGRPTASRRDELLERFDLDPTRRGRAYSKGNRQKVALVAALAIDSELLLLDEPTSGLDPLMEQVFNEALGEHTARGGTVLLSSHVLSEVERLADRVTIIRDGSTVETGSLDDLRHLRRTQVRAEVSGEPPELSSVPGVHGWAAHEGTISFSVDPDSLGHVLAVLAASRIHSVTCTPPTLEDLFLDVYRDDRPAGDTGHDVDSSVVPA
jgi:ABC-2 type transport system ATP-binding protein